MSFENTHKLYSYSKINDLRSDLKRFFLSKLLGKKVLFLDLPIYLNVGDLLIEEGTEALFRELHVKVVGRGSFVDQKRLSKIKIDENILIILQGGGNFGDIYPRHQNYRKKVVEMFPKNEIIMLPQSVHFWDENNFSAEARIFESHKNLLLCARDRYSYDFLSDAMPKVHVELLPDMAYTLLNRLHSENTPHISEKTNRELFFYRKDQESIYEMTDSYCDWSDLIKDSEKRKLKLIKRRLKRFAKLNVSFRAYSSWGTFRRHMIKKAVKHFIKFDKVSSDRLHGVILSQLLGIPIHFRDNNYGKLSRYMDTWFKEVTNGNRDE